MMLKLTKMARAVKLALRDWLTVGALPIEPENLAIEPPAVTVRGRRG